MTVQIIKVTAADYKAERKRRGTQEQVAALLGVSRVTIARRETGTRPVIREAWIALLSLRKKGKRAKRLGNSSSHTTTPVNEV